MRLKSGLVRSGCGSDVAKRALLYFLPLVCLVSGTFTGLYLIGSGTLAAEMQAAAKDPQEALRAE